MTFSPELFRLVFDGPPGPEGGRFVEAETLDGKSMCVGRWEQGEGGYWYLYVSPPMASQPLPLGAAPAHDPMLARSADTPDLKYHYHPATKPAGAGLCPSCGVNPSDMGYACPGCHAYGDHLQ